MDGRWRLAFFSLIFAVLIGWFAFHFLLKAHIRSADFKAFAEAKVGDLLNAKVKIGKIRVNLLNQVALTDLDLVSREDLNTPYKIHVRQVVFRYGLGQLLTQNFAIPREVVLRTPQVLLSGQSFPYGFFQPLKHGKNQDTAIHLQLEKGKIRFTLPGLDAGFGLRDIQGSVRPSSKGKLSVHFRAELEGLLQGSVQGEGEIDPLGQAHHFVLDLKTVSLNAESGLSFEDFHGRIRWEGDHFTIDELTGQCQGWKTVLKGDLANLSKNPILKLEWLLGDGKVSAKGKVEADFVEQKLKGEVHSFGKEALAFQGKIQKEETRLLFQDLWLSEVDYQGGGWVDLKTGNSRMTFEKGKQSFAVESNIKHLNFDLTLNFNHLKFFGLDWVTSSRIHFTPVVSPWDKRLSKWRASFQTDYFILEYIPFDDLQGTFEATSHGIRNLTAKWGRVFELTGHMAFQDSLPQMNMTLRVNGFDLGRIREFASKPLSKKLAGTVEGKVKFEGPLTQPEVLGNVMIKNGQLGKLPYDLGVLEFHGVPPYLKLYNSHILKGRTTLPVTGVLNFSLSNLLHGIQIQTSDNLILLKGWDVSADDRRGDLEIESPFASIPALGVKAGRESPEELAANANKKEEESYFVAGPKFKF